MYCAEGKRGEDDEKDEAPFDYPVTDCVGDGFVCHFLLDRIYRIFWIYSLVGEGDLHFLDVNSKPYFLIKSIDRLCRYDILLMYGNQIF